MTANAPIGRKAIQTDAIGTDEIANSQVTNAKMANSSISFDTDSASPDVVSLGETITVVGGSGITTSNSGANEITVAGDDATTTTKGVASFATADFTVTTGAVAIKADGIDNLQIDWGVAANQVSADDIPDGATNAIITLTQEGNIHTQNTDTGTTSTSFGIDTGGTKVLLKTSAGEMQVRNAGDTDFADLRVENLTVTGTTLTVNSETVTIDDNIIVLNNNEAGAPTENAGIEIERGTSGNAQVLWDEGADEWKCGVVGSLLTIQTGSGTPVAAADTEVFTLVAGDVTNKYVDLTNIPKNASVVAHFEGGNLIETTHYAIITDGADLKRFSWTGKTYLETVAAVDDILQVYYVYV